MPEPFLDSFREGPPPERVWVKICCIQSLEEAHWAIEAGADALGLVARMPSGPGVIEEARIAPIIAGVGDSIATVLLTAETQAAAILAQLRATRPHAVQLCDAVTPAVHAALQEAAPQVMRIQVVHVEGVDSIEPAIAASQHAGALLLDSGKPNQPVKQLGGTGNVHDWSVSRAIVEAVRCPVFLAGGLNPGNVGKAIDQVRPAGVDVCTGIRQGMALDRQQLHAFIRAARQGKTGR